MASPPPSPTSSPPPSPSPSLSFLPSSTPTSLPSSPSDPWPPHICTCTHTSTPSSPCICDPFSPTYEPVDPCAPPVHILDQEAETAIFDNVYSDFRAGGTKKRKERKKNEKYNHFRNVKAGALGQPHYRLLDPQRERVGLAGTGLPADCPVEVWDKARLYKEARAVTWPYRGRRHHADIEKKQKRGKTVRYEKRRGRARERRREVRGYERGKEWEDRYDEELIRQMTELQVPWWRDMKLVEEREENEDETDKFVGDWEGGSHANEEDDGWTIVDDEDEDDFVFVEFDSTD